MSVRAVLLGLLVSCTANAWGHVEKAQGRLPTIGAAPGFALIDQAGERVALADLQGKVLAVTFRRLIPPVPGGRPGRRLCG